MKDNIKAYFKREQEVINNLDFEAITDAVYAIKEAYEREATIYVFGNGGSAATASHFVCDFNKGICEKLAFMGVKIDLDENNMRGEEKVISTPDSTVKVYVIPTNEELMIAKETLRLVK